MGGSSAQNFTSNMSKPAEKQLNTADWLQKQNYANSLADYGSGKSSLQDILSGIQGNIANSHAQAGYDYNNANNAEKQKEIATLTARKNELQGKGVNSSGILGGMGGAAAANNQVELNSIDKQLKDLNTPGFGASGINKNDNTPDSGAALDEAMNQLVYNPLTGSKMAEDQVTNSEMGKGIWGQGGYQSQLLGEQDRLANQGYQLTPEDREAYGQVSGDISRLFGQEESGLANSLAERGLAAAPSGAAGVGYSGLMGNKNERLAKAQTAIADARMQNTMQRLGQTRNELSSVIGQGQNAIQGQYNRNLAGVQARTGKDVDWSKMYQNQIGQQQAQGNTEWQQNQETAFNPGKFLGGLGGAVLGGLTGGLSTGLGSALGAAVGGGNKNSLQSALNNS